MIEIKFTGGSADEVLADIAKMAAIAGGAAPAKQADKTPKPKAEAAAAAPAKTDDADTPVTMELIRKVAAAKAGESDAKAAAAKKLVAEFGAKKLSELKESDYPAFYAKLKNL